MGRLSRAFVLAGLLGLAGCAAGLPPAAPAPAAGFAVAVNRGSAFAVGVYGIGADADADVDDASLPRGDELAPWSTAQLPARVGAGFFIDDSGAVVTAAHVVTGAHQVLVKLPDQRVRPARVRAIDRDMDIALLDMDTPPDGAPVFGRSAALRAGDWVLAVGEPYGLNRSVVAGIVGGRARHFAEDGEVLFIQSDLTLNPGNSGGPLLDARGAIVGMSLRTVVGPYGSSGVSLFMPIEVVQQVVAELRSENVPPRPRLGAGFEDVSPLAAWHAGRADARGAFVNAVARGSVAAGLGLRVGDIVVGMNGRALGDSGDFVRALLSWRALPGTRLTVFRAGGFVELRAAESR
ncbi:S1C family serine protease [Rhizobacter sp. OV335]|uniref:S1C family serine protease n=1 Tax=Rhizobacter sp. OV335 TaxID=1500264 RepID=UPI0009123AC4|nr:trypsin-like peptidase domain-containing protein [Rhizobacter sp. OV335]SHN15172.1 serine protease Do [Rhizobacter sp. OV335]